MKPCARWAGWGPSLIGLAALSVPSAAFAQPPPNPWRVDVSTAYSRLSGGLDPWRQQTVVATYRPDPNDWWSVGLEQGERFGLSDSVVSMRVVRAMEGGATLSAGATASREANFSARSSLRLGVQSSDFKLGPVARSDRQGPGWTASVGLEATLAQYRPGGVRSLQPTITLSRGPDTSVSFKLIETWSEAGESISGYAVSGTLSPRPGLRLRLGYADAPESDSGVTVQAQSVFGGFDLDLGDLASIRMTVTHEERSAFDRDEVVASLMRRF
jgi:YaiO family outer membrane protein